MTRLTLLRFLRLVAIAGFIATSYWLAFYHHHDPFASSALIVGGWMAAILALNLTIMRFERGKWPWDNN